MTPQERSEYIACLRRCTLVQLISVYERERAASRTDYAQLAIDEGHRRGFSGVEPMDGWKLDRM